MTAFDTDIVTLVLNGSSWYVERAAQIPVAELAVPIAVYEEMCRGRLNAIHQADSGKAGLSVPNAYEMFRRTVESLSRYRFLRFDDDAESLVKEWQRAKVKVGTLDMRIAASCVIAKAKLVSRNRRDFGRLPGLTVEYWNDTVNRTSDDFGVSQGPGQ